MVDRTYRHPASHPDDSDRSRFFGGTSHLSIILIQKTVILKMIDQTQKEDMKIRSYDFFQLMQTRRPVRYFISE
jgi:hypothetical protein